MSNTALKIPLEQTNGHATVIEFSRDEMNLAEFPLAVLSTRTNPNIKTLEFSDTTKSANGELVKRDWIITGADKFGLPTSTDDDVILGLICLSKQGEFKERKVYFTRYELLKILQWTTEGRSYTRLSKSLDRLSGLRIKATNAFYDNASKAYLTKNFGIIDAYELKDERANAKNPNSYFIWSEAMFNSFRAGYIRKINLGFYFALNSSVARRLYRYLDKYFYFNPVIKKPLLMFAFEKLGLSRTYKYVSSIKQQIVPACKELVEKGFLESFEFSGNGEDTMIHFTKRTEAKRIDAVRIDTVKSSPGKPNMPIYEVGGGHKDNAGSNMSDLSAYKAQAEITALLTERGILPKQAKKLLENCNEDELNRIAEIISYFDTLVQKRDPKISRNPIGFLYRAVESPQRFKLPASISTGIPTAAARPPRKACEFESKAKEDKLKQAAYEQYRTCMVEAYKKNISEDTIREVQAYVETKVRHLKTILRPKNYIEARDGLVKQEIANHAGVVSFEEWKKMVG